MWRGRESEAPPLQPVPSPTLSAEYHPPTWRQLVGKFGEGGGSQRSEKIGTQAAFRLRLRRNGR